MLDQKLIGNFVALPESTLDSQQWKDFTASTCKVYTTMLRKYKHWGKGSSGKVRWRQDELAKASGFTRQTIVTCLDELKESGWISVWEPGGRWVDGTTYDMAPEWANGKEVKK